MEGPLQNKNSLTQYLRRARRLFNEEGVGYPANCSVDEATFMMVSLSSPNLARLVAVSLHCRTFYTFRLQPKPCDRSIMAEGASVCDVTTEAINKIAIRVDYRALLCFNQSRMTTIDPGYDYRNCICVIPTYCSAGASASGLMPTLPESRISRKPAWSMIDNTKFCTLRSNLAAMDVFGWRNENVRIGLNSFRFSKGQNGLFIPYKEYITYKKHWPSHGQQDPTNHWVYRFGTHHLHVNTYANEGTSVDQGHIELFIYGLKGDYVNGTFMVQKCNLGFRGIEAIESDTRTVLSGASACIKMRFSARHASLRAFAFLFTICEYLFWYLIHACVFCCRL
ncbi:hypothetical protein VOLCADRAFT_92888 [Volvox carteri f. nagariensis]|uniref:Uncharacterized protein n=1 Tax=Volvox carteri f. nagariensis TaxID=3068 RepID=D8U0Q7_VOLCA|nr:uncharacterized protein VOLCADRAFT_92888 [Volvox carteri f. nagariensis]EFJ46680.1 hypothetical protein VOLCADRAFT_92888 [Volvox carteri f. nagariensis]|eukprot:XP_002952209.1 hypothetical protein VOLCADRAFT_92888 [Volvox carteri f. nagariensis]